MVTTNVKGDKKYFEVLKIPSLQNSNCHRNYETSVGIAKKYCISI